MSDTQEQLPVEQTKKANPIAEFRSLMEGGMRAEIAKALPKDIDPDRFIRTTITAVQMNPDLLNADRRSLLAACMRAAQDGLLPDGREAVLNIYNTKVKDRETGRDAWVQMVQFLPMVRGLLKCMRNSGEIAHIDAAAVYAKDHFRFTRGDDPRIEHEPYLGEDDPGPVVAAYMIVKLRNGEIHREVMSKRDIEKVRAASKSPDGPGWRNWYDQFAIKSVLKRGAKLLPSSSDRLDRVIDHDNEAMGFDGFNQRGADATALMQQQAAPVLTDERATQDLRRPSRLASIVKRAKSEQPVAQQAAEGLPAEQAPAEDSPPWDEDDQRGEAA